MLTLEHYRKEDENMVQSLTSFAGNANVAATNRRDPVLSKQIIEYIKEKSDFRQFVKVMNVDSYVTVLPRKWSTGIAVEVVEGSEIPKARNVYDDIVVKMKQNGTGIRMTTEAQIMMGQDEDLWASETQSAAQRMLDKENQDCCTTLLSGAGLTVTSTSHVLTFDDVVDLKTELEEDPYGMSPNIILMSSRSYADLVKDEKFRDYSQSGMPGVVTSGDVGREIAGMRIYIIREVEDNVYIIDNTKTPIYLLQMGVMNTESYRIPETREDVLDLTFYEHPAILRPDAIGKLEITRQEERRTFPEGWDPLTGFPQKP